MKNILPQFWWPGPLSFLHRCVKSGSLQITGGEYHMSSLMRRFRSFWMQLKPQRMRLLGDSFLGGWFMNRKVPISTGQTGNIIDGKSRGCNSELDCWWLHRSRKDFSLRMNYAVTAFATRALGNWVNCMTECVCVCGIGPLQRWLLKLLLCTISVFDLRL